MPKKSEEKAKELEAKAEKLRQKINEKTVTAADVIELAELKGFETGRQRDDTVLVTQLKLQLETVELLKAIKAKTK